MRCVQGSPFVLLALLASRRQLWYNLSVSYKFTESEVIDYEIIFLER